MAFAAVISLRFYVCDKAWIMMRPWLREVTVTHVCDFGGSSSRCETLIFEDFLPLGPELWEGDKGIDLEAGCNGLRKMGTVLPSSIFTSRRRGLIASTKRVQ